MPPTGAGLTYPVMAGEADRPLRVLYWTEGFHPYTGGTEILGSTLLAGLRERGHAFTVVTSHGPLDLPDRDEHEGIPVHRLPFHSAVTGGNPALMLGILKRLDRIEREARPDITHVNAVGASLVFHLRSSAPHAPWAFTPHAPLAGQRTGPDTILGQAFRSADWTVCLSEAQRRSITQIAPWTRDRSSVIYCALEPPKGDPSPLPFDPPCLVGLGRQVRDKAFDVALDAFGAIAERFPEVRLVLVGEGPEQPALQRQAESLGVAARVDFPGRVPDTRPYLDAATLVLMPSRWEETFGLVALEAALMGRPVVAARAGALTEVVRDGVTGLLFDKEDADGMARRIGLLLERPEVARRMGRAARARALDVFGLERCIDRYDELYRLLASGERREAAPGSAG